VPCTRQHDPTVVKMAKLLIFYEIYRDSPRMICASSY